MSLWEPVETSGLPDDLDFTIAKAEFGYDAAYLDGEQILFMITASQLYSDGPLEGEPYSNFYSLGRAGAWETLDHGDSVVSQSDPPVEGFNKQSLYWKFIEAAVVSGAESVVQSRGLPDNAKIWEGLTFHMNRVEVDYGGEIGKREVLLPTKYVGESGKADTPAATPSAPADNSGDAGVTNLLGAQVKALAKNSPTHDAFIEAVMEKHPEAQSDEALFSSILDEAGIYAEVNG